MTTPIRTTPTNGLTTTKRERALSPVNTMTPTLIYCAKKNLFAPIALECGLKYGAQLPNSVYAPPYFADQDWKRPRRAAYLAALAEHRPALATVLDLEKPSQLDDVLAWAFDAAEWVTEAIIIVPKCRGVIKRLPLEIRGRRVRLGYSVPTSHGKTSLDAHAFMGREVHILGGNPLEQYRLALPHFDQRGRYVALDVRSVDCNYIQLKAVRWGEFLECVETPAQWSMFGAKPATRWRQLKEVGLGGLSDAPYEAFRRSCETLVSMWASIKKTG